MRTARLILVTLVASVAFGGATTPVGATGPSDEGRTLTTVEQAASDAKVAAAEAYAAATKGADLTTLACVLDAGTSKTSGGLHGATALVQPECDIPRGTLAVLPRDQTKGHYCGPAVGQVISNYVWGISDNRNKFTQAEIARIMGTDAAGSTNAWALEAGLEVITRGAPRRPAGWNWVVTPVVDSDGDGTTGDQLHQFVRANVSGSRMPLAMSLKPHDAASQFHLFSWPRAVRSIGHWISVYGWLGVWRGDDSARIYYTDSSADEGGATGKFWTPTRHIAAMLQEHTRRIVW